MKRSPLSRGSGFKRPERPPRAPIVLVPVAEPSKAVMRRADAGHAPVQKAGRHESEAWRRAVASLPCVLCDTHGRTQAAHRNEGKAMSLKTDDAWTAALCDRCHSEIDQGSTLTRDERRERIDRAILLTVRELAIRGLIAPTGAKA